LYLANGDILLSGPDISIRKNPVMRARNAGFMFSIKV